MLAQEQRADARGHADLAHRGRDRGTVQGIVEQHGFRARGAADRHDAREVRGDPGRRVVGPGARRIECRDRSRAFFRAQAERIGPRRSARG